MARFRKNLKNAGKTMGESLDYMIPQKLKTREKRAEGPEMKFKTKGKKSPAVSATMYEK